MLMMCVFMRFIVRRTKHFDQRARFTPPHSRSVLLVLSSFLFLPLPC